MKRRVTSSRARAARVLDFDTEARPLSWYAGDWVTKEVTAIAAAWVGPDGKAEGDVHVWTLNPFEHMDLSCIRKTRQAEDFSAEFDRAMDVSTRLMLKGFVEFYDQADMVTGHYIRGYDLGVLNAAMLEFELPPLRDKLTCDTKGDLVKFSGLSKSQENLGALMKLDHQKVDMNQRKWRAANRLSREGIQLTRERVVGDVLQHIEMRHKLLKEGLLRAPRVWSGTASGATPQYTP